MERPNNTFKYGEERLTNPTVHLEPHVSLNLTLGFTNPTVQLFSCNYCWRKLKNSQALGGHQNAHKHGRTMAKRAKMEKMLSERYACMASPLHGSSLPLYGSGFQSTGMETHAASLDHEVQAMTGGERFEQSYLGIPIYMEEDELKPNSFGMVASITSMVLWFIRYTRPYFETLIFCSKE